MSKIKNFIINNKSIIIIFTIFFILLFTQYQFLYLYHDDYGYASLSYAYRVEGVDGINFNVNQLAEFLKGHYVEWGGRILGFFFEIILLSKGIWLYRLVQAIIITGIYFMVFKIVKRMFLQKSISDWLLALLSVVGYGLFEIMLVRSGIFWITASVIYVFPILPLLIFIYLYQDSKEKEFRNKIIKVLFYILNAILLFVATFSQEQIAIATLSYIVILTIYNIVKNKKIDYKDIIMSIISAIAFIILMVAPGNEIRQQHPTSIEFYNKPFLERIFIGLQNLILGNFSSYTNMFSMLFYFSIMYAAYNIVNKKVGLKILNKISLISIVCIIVTSLLKQEGYFGYIYNLLPYEFYKNIITIIFFIQLAFMLYAAIVYLFDNNQLKLINILISAMLSQACMVVAPYFALRSAIIFEILCFIFMLYVFVDFYNKVKNKKILSYFLIAIIILSIINFLTITIGYYKNSTVNEENHNILIDVSYQLKSGNNIEAVTLKKLPNILYSGDQPYMAGNDYIKIYMREYYNLPEDFVINYE